MLLHQVLKLLARNIDGAGYGNSDCFQIIFDDNDSIYAKDDDAIRKLFAGSRGLTQKAMRSLCDREGFENLCKNIEINYLPIAGNHKGLFNDLSLLLTQSDYMKENDKQKIIAACDYRQTAELSRFIAACLICGNYNTKQSKLKKPLIRENYALNLDFMKLNISMESIEIKKELWIAAQRNLIESRRKGNRFYSLNIIERLLPYGYVDMGYLVTQGKTEEGAIAPLVDLCRDTDENIAIVGDGGIGKTTFLQHLMQETFLSADGTPVKYMPHASAMFFIELNRCPEHIGDWYDNSLKKTNFITRYIGQIKENHSSLDSVSEETLNLLEKEFQKIPPEGEKPQYLLLLDGFNEVRSDRSIRTYLSNEISVLNHYPNVRIITTSRETQSAYYASEFKTIRLIGLNKSDIREYLHKCKMPGHSIGNTMACESLVRCLKIPLYLCMFSAKNSDDNFLPQTAGEILYNFFHRDSAFYNARMRMQETRSCKLDSKQIALVLDFIIPYIGWTFETNDTFSVNEQEFHNIAEQALKCTKTLMCISCSNPFKDFNYNGKILKNTVESLYVNDKPDIDAIISCIYDYLGIVYQYQINEGEFSDRVRFSFCHHHFRDYFSAMWDVQLLSMLQCINEFGFDCSPEECSYQYYLDKRHWQTEKVQFVSEVLMEHRNRPILSLSSGNWYIPKPTYDEQRVLSRTLDYCRKLHKNDIDTQYLIQNVLSAILYGRKEYSGLNLSNLNLKNCRFFNITCSRKGKSHTLAADFSGSTLTKDNFVPEGHQNAVVEYIYNGNQCFTVDNFGVVKCWDILSGRMEYELQSKDPLGISDFSSKGFINVSNDGCWLAAKVQETQSDGDVVYVNLFDLTNPSSKPKAIMPRTRHKMLTYFTFTSDSKSLLMLCDRKVVYCVDLMTQDVLYECEFNLYRHSELYAESAHSCIFAYTAEYSVYETDPTIMSTWINDDAYSDEAGEWDYSDDEDEDDDLLAIPCSIYVLIPDSSEMQLLYDFASAPGTSPTITFAPEKQWFLLHNYNNHCLEKYDCKTKKCRQVLEELKVVEETPPASIQVNPSYPNELYIVYPDVCFNVEVSDDGSSSILMIYNISGAEKLLENPDNSDELEFKPNVTPTMNRFIVSDDSNTYEWDIENDRLTLRYNTTQYGCSALFADPIRNSFILVHENNGVSIFNGEPLKLVNQYCFQEPGYLINNSVFDADLNLIALSFTKPEHEKIILLNLSTGEQKDIYSTIYTGESIENLCFSNNGNTLLITTQYRCMEYDLQQDISLFIANSGENERFVAGAYVGDEIEIAVVEHSCVAEPRVKPYCIYYKKKSCFDGYKFDKVWCYEMPFLEKSDFQYFLHSYNDFGRLGSLDEKGMQQYWVTEGFFIEKNEHTKKLLTPKCFMWQKNRKVSYNKKFGCRDVIFVYHSSALENQYGCGESSYSYIYLSNNMNEAIFTKSRIELYYCKNIKALTYQSLEENFKKHTKNAHQNAFWDFAVPQNSNTLLGCYESYNLISVNAADNMLLDTVEYFPGISIFGCNFSNASIDEGAQLIIKANGA